MRKRIAMGSLGSVQYHSPTDSPELGPLAKTIEEIVDNSALETTVKETWKAALTKLKNNEPLSAEEIQLIKDLSLFSRISNPDGMYDDAVYALHKKMLVQGIEITPYINVRLLDAFETLKISLHAEGKTPPKLFQSQESWKGIPWENDTDVEFYRIKNASGQKVSYASVVLSKSDEALLIADDEEVSQLSESMAAASMADSGGASAGSTAPSKTEDLQEAKQAVETQWVIESSSRTITKKGHTAVDHIQPFAIIRERMQKVLTHLSQNRTLAKHALQLSDLKTQVETQRSLQSNLVYIDNKCWTVISDITEERDARTRRAAFQGTTVRKLKVKSGKETEFIEINATTPDEGLFRGNPLPLDALTIHPPGYFLLDPTNLTRVMGSKYSYMTHYNQFDNLWLMDHHANSTDKREEDPIPWLQRNRQFGEAFARYISKTREETQISELVDRSDIMYTVRNTWRVNQPFRGACLGFVAKAWLHKNPRYFLTVLATEKSHEKSLRLLYFVQDVLDQLSLAPRERELLTTLVNQLKQQYEGLSSTRNALRNAIEKILGDHEGEL